MDKLADFSELISTTLMTVLQKSPVTYSNSTIDSMFYLYPKISLNLSREGGEMRDTGNEVAKNSLLYGGVGQYFYNH